MPLILALTDARHGNILGSALATREVAPRVQNYDVCFPHHTEDFVKPEYRQAPPFSHNPFSDL
jgi:hypothetical protein